MGLDQWIVKENDINSEELAYFRKSNAIHGYIIKKHADGNDECYAPIELTKQDINTLLDAIHEDIYYKGENLNPTEGLFFGVYEKDQRYWAGLGMDYEKLRLLYNKLEEDETVYYWTSW